MFSRIAIAWSVGMTVLIVGCGTKTASSYAPGSQDPVTDAAHVTLHVKDMAKLLKLG
jgi:hypothetical protein